MSAPQNPMDSGDWRRLVEPAKAYAPYFAIAMAVIAVPLALLYLTPLVLGLFAPRLDPSIDLYAVNRPLAFTFLDASGNDVGHRGAIVGNRLSLKDMPSYLPAAFIAMEDRRFYSHNGIDPRGLARALFRDAYPALRSYARHRGLVGPDADEWLTIAQAYRGSPGNGRTPGQFGASGREQAA